MTISALRQRRARRTGLRADRVIPLWANVVGYQTELINILVAVRNRLLVKALVQVSRDLQAGLRPCPPYIPEHDLQRPQGLACPVPAYLAEQPVLYRIPFRCTFWENVHVMPPG